MAEFVEKRLLETIGEVEEMEFLGLISSKEKRKLVEKRRENEYRIARRTKFISSFITYVNYERDLLTLLTLRREKIQQNNNVAKIEAVIKLRLVKILRNMSYRWPGCKEVWNLRIEFTKSIGWKSEVSIGYKKWLAYHGENPELWVSWASWEVQMNRNFDKAREILYIMAPTMCPKSQLIYSEIFRLELIFIETLKRRQENSGLEAMEEIISKNRQKILNCSLARVVYENAVKEIPEPEMYYKLYEITKKYPFAKQLGENIFEDLLKNFQLNEKVWRILTNVSITNPDAISPSFFNTIKIDLSKDMSMKVDACSEDHPTLNIHSLTEDIKSISFIVPEEKADCPAYKIIERLMFILDLGMKKIGPKFSPTVIEDLLLYLFNSWTVPEICKVFLNKIMEICSNFTQHLSFKHYIIWLKTAEYLSSIDLLKDDQLSVVEKALEQFPDSEPLLLNKLKIQCDAATSDQQLLEVMNTTALMLTDEYCLEAFSYIASKCSAENKHKVYDTALTSSYSMVNKSMKVQCLQYISSKQLSDELWKKYDSMKMSPPFTAKIHSTVILHELKDKDCCVDRVRSAFKTAVAQFGETHYGLWLSYIYFEKKRGSAIASNLLRREAEQQLLAQHLSIYKDVLFDIDNNMFKEEDSNLFTISRSEDTFMEELGLREMKVFPGAPVPTYSVCKVRDKFFRDIVHMYESTDNIKNVLKKPLIEEENLIWQDILQELTKESVLLPTPAQIKKKTKKLKAKSLTSLKSEITNKIQGSKRHIEPTNFAIKNFQTDEVEEILQKSKVIQPEFMKQNVVEPYYMCKMKQKRLNKKKVVTTAGSDWYDMKAPEMTEELKRDLDLLKMRAVLDPKQHYKGSSLKYTPKHFEVGTYVDAPQDYYVNRGKSKSKKRTLAEELIENEGVLRYQKKKCTEIISAKNKMSFRHKQNSKKTPGKGKGKLAKNNALC